MVPGAARRGSELSHELRGRNRERREKPHRDEDPRDRLGPQCRARRPVRRHQDEKVGRVAPPPRRGMPIPRNSSRVRPRGGAQRRGAALSGAPVVSPRWRGRAREVVEHRSEARSANDRAEATHAHCQHLRRRGRRPPPIARRPGAPRARGRVDRARGGAPCTGARGRDRAGRARPLTARARGALLTPPGVQHRLCLCCRSRRSPASRDPKARGVPPRSERQRAQRLREKAPGTIRSAYRPGATARRVTSGRSEEGPTGTRRAAPSGPTTPRAGAPAGALSNKEFFHQS